MSWFAPHRAGARPAATCWRAGTSPASAGPPRPAARRVHGPRLDRRRSGSCCAGRTPGLVVRHGRRAGRWPACASGRAPPAACSGRRRRARRPPRGARRPARRAHGAAAGRRAAPSAADGATGWTRSRTLVRAAPARRRPDGRRWPRVVAADPRRRRDDAGRPGRAVDRASCGGGSTAPSGTDRRSTPGWPACSASPTVAVRRPSRAGRAAGDGRLRRPVAPRQGRPGDRRAHAAPSWRRRSGAARSPSMSDPMTDRYKTRRRGRRDDGRHDRDRRPLPHPRRRLRGQGRRRRARRLVEPVAVRASGLPATLVGHVVDVHGMMLRAARPDAERAPTSPTTRSARSRRRRADLEAVLDDPAAGRHRVRRPVRAHEGRGHRRPVHGLRPRRPRLGPGPGDRAGRDDRPGRGRSDVGIVERMGTRRDHGRRTASPGPEVAVPAGCAEAGPAARAARAPARGRLSPRSPSGGRGARAGAGSSMSEALASR